MAARAAAVAILAGMLLSGCCHPLRPIVRAPWNGVCEDGLPVKMLIDNTCPEGVCGWSCLPGRWRAAGE